MKLAPLLGQYLYTNKRLDLPGIGTFLLDPSFIMEEESSKHSKQNNIEGISFENSSTPKDITALIAFISQQTGKMKALAAADFDSYMEHVNQFLNIGKPFLFEGIGSLVRIRSGQYAFTSGQVMPEKMKEYSAKEISSTSSTEESFASFKDKTAGSKANRKWRKPVAFLLILAGVALAIWGGYTMYKKTKSDDNITDVPAQADSTGETGTVQLVDSSSLQKDTSQVIVKDSVPVIKDSTAAVPVQNNNPAPQDNSEVRGNYKFVVETANKERGLLRYGTLKGWGLKIKMETTDSVRYKIFFVLPATPSDTSRVRDSIGNLYSPYWQKAFVEK